ncbi:hypothetical protein GCM10027258_05070 [Amycolatopsis stemonae]
MEWIEDTPAVGGATADGANPGLTANDKISLVQNGVTYSTPSGPSGGNAFSVSCTGP